MDEPFLEADSSQVSLSESVITLELGTRRDEFFGDFRFRGDDIFGTVEGFRVTVDDAVDFDITNLGRDAETFVRLFESASQKRFEAFLFSGNDRFRLSGDDDSGSGFNGDDVIRGRRGDDSLNGGAGDDRVIGNAGADRLRGQAGDDLVRGGGGDDRVIGGGGDDRLLGNGGNDKVRGGGGNDTLDGGGGNDRLIGGAGDDTLIGGRGADVFVFGANDGEDVIRRYEDGTDLIELSGVVGFGGLTIQQDGADVTIAFESTLIRVENANEGDFSAADFLF